ncbi:Protein of unknown function [Paracoccus tibetensis]|uniref:DUF2924 domain-containing protein n=2 Tax=Paracoccus tibetensis TaxID=336292 RepID=A0A1G5J5Z9_9RHOB|nr:Protein of unknown function [Paracoccus tibetensis]
MPRVSMTLSTADALPVAEILSLDRQGLVAAWTALHGAAPPRSISQPLLRRILALDLQLRAAGGWPHGLEARLAKAAAQGVPARTPEPVAGGRLLREWNGITHVVEISPDGYRWNGQHWRSLSVIAREITGAHWSGPRFFGLTVEKKAREKRTREILVRGGSGTGASARSRSAASATATSRDQVSP